VRRYILYIISIDFTFFFIYFGYMYILKYNILNVFVHVDVGLPNQEEKLLKRQFNHPARIAKTVGFGGLGGVLK